jgi:hypothetical protein
MGTHIAIVDDRNSNFLTSGGHPMKAPCFLIGMAAFVAWTFQATASAPQGTPSSPANDATSRRSGALAEIATETERGTRLIESAPVAIPDISKRAIELPVEGLVIANDGPEDDANANPLVEPGKVRWHGDFASACAASSESGKPVLLFQLLGELDHRFT